MFAQSLNALTGRVDWVHVDEGEQGLCGMVLAVCEVMLQPNRCAVLLGMQASRHGIAYPSSWLGLLQTNRLRHPFLDWRIRFT